MAEVGFADDSVDSTGVWPCVGRGVGLADVEDGAGVAVRADYPVEVLLGVVDHFVAEVAGEDVVAL